MLHLQTSEKRFITRQRSSACTSPEFRDQPYEYEASFAAAGDGGALLVCVSPIFFRERQVLAAAALRRRAATMFGLREFVEGGGLVSYGRSESPLTASTTWI